ncbi:hypothetical protein M9H77_31632 [Catharanthus roseus]|uniref:Uncharacterized protein n=1 Tax=Catharanthus roseus TaxID=4058 RepID=A0ACC0A0L0_CATRO|nr:hypothetical protein M9H77_31632 [Catharanthus roseus]
MGLTLLKLAQARGLDLNENNFFLNLKLQAYVDYLILSSSLIFLSQTAATFFLTTPRRPDITSRRHAHPPAFTLYDNRHLCTTALCRTHVTHYVLCNCNFVQLISIIATPIQVKHLTSERLSLDPTLLSRNHKTKQLGNDDEETMVSRLKESLFSKADSNFLNVSEDEDDEDDVEE